MTTRRRPRRVWQDDEPGTEDRWMASYMDMVTVLLVLFIILFAMSSVDQTKYEKLRNSLATGFGAVEVGKIDAVEGVIVPPERIDEVGESEVEVMFNELDDLLALREEIRASLKKDDLEDTVQFSVDARGLTIRLVGTETFFEPNRTELTAQSLQVLGSVAPPLARTDHDISVEGHADFRGQAYPFPTDWELSSGRATNVLRNLVETGGVEPRRIGAVGYGSARPTTTGSSLAELALNRRVDIVVLAHDPVALDEFIMELKEKQLTS